MNCARAFFFLLSIKINDFLCQRFSDTLSWHCHCFGYFPLFPFSSTSINHGPARKANGFVFSRHNEWLIATVSCCKRFFNSYYPNIYICSLLSFHCSVWFRLDLKSACAESWGSQMRKHAIQFRSFIKSAQPDSRDPELTLDCLFIYLPKMIYRVFDAVISIWISNACVRWFPRLIRNQTKRKLICHEAIINHSGETKCKH